MVQSSSIGKEPQWALESTLQSLLTQARDQNKVLHAMATAAGIDAKRVQELNNEISQSTRVNEKVVKSVDDLERSMSRGIGTMNDILSSRPGSIMGGLKDSFYRLGYSVDTVGTAAGKLGRQLVVALEVGQIAYSRINDMANAVFEAYDAGVAFAGGMTELNRGTAALGMTMDQLTKLMIKNSLVVSQLGTRRTIELGRALGTATRMGTDLGMTNEQVTETMLNYVDVLRVTNQLQGKSTADIVAGTKEYATQLNAVSQATGKRRADIEAEIKQRAKSPSYLAVINRLGPEAREAFTKAIVQFEKLGPMASTIQDMVAQTINRGSIAGLDAAKRLALTQSGADKRFYDYINALRQNNVAEADKAISDVFTMLQQYSEQTGQGLAIGAGLASEMQQFAAQAAAEQAGLSERLSKSGQAIASDAARQVQTQQEINAALAALNAEVNEILLPIIKSITPAFRALADVVRTTTGAINKLLEILHLRSPEGGTTGDAGMSAGSIFATVAAVVGVMKGRNLIGALLAKSAPEMLSSIAKAAPGLSAIGGAAAAKTAEKTAETVAAGASRGIMSSIGGKLGLAGSAFTAYGLARDSYDESGSIGRAATTGGGAFAGALGGAALGTALFPGLGTIGGLIVGGVMGSLGATFGGELATGIYDLIAGSPTAAGSAIPDAQTQSTVESDRLNAQRQLDDVNKNLEQLNQTLQDQTRELRDAYSRGSGNIW